MSGADDVRLAAACRELRSLLEEFHAHMAGGSVVQRAQISTQDLGARMNRLAALERGEVPA